MQVRMVMVPAIQPLMPAGAIHGFGEALILAEAADAAEAGAAVGAEADLVIGKRFKLALSYRKDDIMPRGDGTGPIGQGPGTGRGMGRGQGQGRGRMGGPFAAGPGGNCVCPSCGATVAHAAGQPCNATSCSICGTRMTRQ